MNRHVTSTEGIEERRKIGEGNRSKIKGDERHRNKKKHEKNLMNSRLGITQIGALHLTKKKQQKKDVKSTWCDTRNHVINCVRHKTAYARYHLLNQAKWHK